MNAAKLGVDGRVTEIDFDSSLEQIRGILGEDIFFDLVGIRRKQNGPVIAQMYVNGEGLLFPDLPINALVMKAFGISIVGDVLLVGPCKNTGKHLDLDMSIVPTAIRNEPGFSIKSFGDHK